MSLAFVIPTRHRPQLAIAAVRALLAQNETPLTVVVSDNSSREDDVRQLRELCDAAADRRLLYIRPPAELPMAAHWDWALQQAMARTAATHFGIHYDRMIARPGSAGQLARTCARHEETLVRYGCDFTYASGDGFVAWPFPGTGKDFEIRTARVVELTARGTMSTIGHAWPILMNCMVPRPVLDRIRARFGTICDSATPDGAFAYRFCALAGRYVFLDRSLSVMYAYRFSNGQAYLRGDTTGTADYMKLWGDRPWLEAAPIPGLHLGLNIIIHEYNLVRREVGEQLLPPVEWEGYLQELARGLSSIEDPRQQAAMRGILEKHGWRPDPPPPKPALWRRALRRLRRAWSGAAWLQPAGVSREPGGLKPRRSTSSEAIPSFATEGEAVDFLLTQSRPPAEHNALLDVLEPVELGGRP